MRGILCFFTISLILVVSANSIVSQNSNISSMDEFQLINAPPAPIRQPAEFEPMQGVLIQYPFGISYDIIAEMAEDVEVVTIVADSSEQSYVESQYTNHGINLSHCSFLVAPSDSYWTRDYGPWFAFTGDDELGVVDFEYNRPRPNDNNIPSAYANDQGLSLYEMPLAHAGGNYMTDGQGIAISTDLIETENPGLSHSEIEQIANDYLGIHTYHMVPDVNGEYIKHIDCWAKYLASDIIMIREVPTDHAQYDEIEAAVDYFETQTSCYGTPYEIVRVYTPNNEPYTNSLILNDKVLVPIKGNEWDDEAIEAYENAMPGYEVLGFTGTWQSTDALHCRAKGIPDRYMLYIEHTPLSGFQTSDDGFDIDANIVSYSGQGLIAESTLIYWKVEGGEWNSIQMQHIGDNNYIATIPSQDVGETVYYYIHAEDNSGRIENHPYIGALGAHSFIVYDESNSPPEKPSTPSGKKFGRPGVEYTYKTDTVDPDDNQVFYMWDWGDGNFSKWLGPYDSGDICEASHTWDKKGTYSIRVRAKDIFDEESDWSDPLKMRVPKSFPFIDFLEGSFPRLSFLLSILLRFQG